MAWVVLRAAPQSEFKSRDRLHAMGISAYVPVEFESRSAAGGKNAVRRSPILRGYVFADVHVQAWPAIASVREIKGAILLGDRPATLTQREMDAIELLSRPLVRPGRGVRFRPGDRVQLRRGAFAALEGIVSRVERGGRIVAAVEMFGKLCEVKVDQRQVEAA